MASNAGETLRLLTDFLLLYLCIFSELVSGSQKCGVPLPLGKIIGGVDSGGYHYPWFALLLLKGSSHTRIPVCGGSLIAKQYVLTAAHCFNIDPLIQNQDLFNVALGVYDICDDKEATRQIFNVAQVFVHEMYRKNGKFFDIALMKLDRQAEYTPACLPLSGVLDATEPALLIGFGVTDENSDSTPCHMMEVNVTKFSKMDCSSSKLPAEDKKEPSVICAGVLKGGIDSCYGDSGGPLHTRTPDDRYVLAGIVSYGYGCAVPEIPGIYTNVGSYLQWIQDKMSDNGSKKHRNNKPYRPNLFIQRRGGVSRKQQTTITFPDERMSHNISQPTADTTATGIDFYWMNRTHQKTIEPRKDKIFHQGQGHRHLENSHEKPKVTFPQN